MDIWISDYLFPLIIILIGIGCGPAIWYFINSVQAREKREIRAQYMELVKEKLDVIKTALAMGKSDDEIAALDRRLSRLIGTEKMLKTLKKGKSGEVTTDEELATLDIMEELNLLREGRGKTTE
jgi:hypothetical protein